MGTSTIRNTALLTGLHLLVDGLCACCVFMQAPMLDAQSCLILFILYNALAFLTQPLMGWVVDKRTDSTNIFKSSIAFLILGACVALLAQSFGNGQAALSLLSITLVGLGNSLFHVFGGKSVAAHTGNDMRHLGVFVSSGAIGLVIGERFASVTELTTLCLMLLLLAYALLQTPSTLSLRSTTSCDEEFCGNEIHSKARLPLLLFIMLIVFIRAFLGKMTPGSPGIEQLAQCGILLGVLAFAGKSLGGFIGHRIGVWRMLTITLWLSGISFLLCSTHIAFAMTMTLAINLTMPLTLYLANRSMPGREGFSFGLLAAMLPLGVGLGSLCADIPIATPLLYALIATIAIEAIALLAMSERRWQVLAMSVVMNILTNLPLNILAYHYPQVHTSLPLQIGLECAVVAIEALLFWVVLQDKRKAFTYAILCNAISYLLGLLYSIVF